MKHAITLESWQVTILLDALAFSADASRAGHLDGLASVREEIGTIIRAQTKAMRP